MTINFPLGPLLGGRGYFYTNHPPSPETFIRDIYMTDMSECGSCQELSILSVGNYNHTKNTFSVVIGNYGEKSWYWSMI